MNDSKDSLLLFQATKFLGTTRDALLSLVAAGKIKAFVSAPAEMVNYLGFPPREKLFNISGHLISEAKNRFSEDFFFNPYSTSPFNFSDSRKYTFDDLHFQTSDLNELVNIKIKKDKNKRSAGQEERQGKRRRKIFQATVKYVKSTVGRKKRDSFWTDEKFTATMLAEQIFENRFKLELVKAGKSEQGYSFDAIYDCVRQNKDKFVSLFKSEETK